MWPSNLLIRSLDPRTLEPQVCNLKPGKATGIRIQPVTAGAYAFPRKAVGLGPPGAISCGVKEDYSQDFLPFYYSFLK
jgi:hypothetical protein